MIAQFTKGQGAALTGQLQTRSEQRQTLEAQVEIGRSAGLLAQQPAYQALEMILRERIDMALQELRRAQEMLEVVRLQGQLMELDAVLRIVPEAIAAGQAAQRQWKLTQEGND